VVVLRVYRRGKTLTQTTEQGNNAEIHFKLELRPPLGSLHILWGRGYRKYCGRSVSEQVPSVSVQAGRARKYEVIAFWGYENDTYV
jgi:hypothetical protein